MIKASIQNAIANNMAGRQQKIKKRLGSEGEYQMQRKKWVDCVKINPKHWKGGRKLQEICYCYPMGANPI